VKNEEADERDWIQLYRAYIIWERNILAVSLPLLTWLSYIGIAITGNLSCTSVVPPIERFTKVVVAYYSLSVATNALCTLLIVSKILWHQRQIRGAGIDSEKDYQFMSSLMAESGFWYAVTGIVNAVLVAKENDLQAVSGAVFGAMAVRPFISF
jgi:hypothetical protein